VCVTHEWRYGGRDGLTAEDGLTIGCEAPYRLVCGCGEVRLARCGRSSTRVCGPCGGRSRGRVRHVASSGHVDGARELFVTVTAPSWRPHFLPDGRACRCTGSLSSRKPSADLATWNASAGQRFNRLVMALRRELGDVAYFKAAEVQRRGALHFHLLVRVPAGARLPIGRLRAIAIRYGFGHSVDVQPIQPHHAAYVAKYASKAAGERDDVPWNGWARVERIDRHTGEVTRGHRKVYRASYRTWSASRDWGRLMRDVRRSQAHYEIVMSALPNWERFRVYPEGELVLSVPARPRGG
jgi:hypothetical protein